MSADISAELNALIDRIHKETAHSAYADAAKNHAAFPEILAYGEKAIPILLKRLEESLDETLFETSAVHVCCTALGVLTTGRSQLEDAKAGTVKDLAQSWVEWGKMHTYYGRGSGERR